MTDHEMLLAYLLKIITPTGRQVIKDFLMEEIGKPDNEMAGKLLNEINRVERAFGQLDRMTDEERRRMGIKPRGGE